MIEDVRRAPNTGSRARLRKDGRFETRLTVGRRPDGAQIQRSFFGATAQEAETKRDEAKRQLDGGIILAGERVTLLRYLRDWLEVTKDTVRPSTWIRYRQLVENNIAPALGHVPLVKATPAAVERMLASSTLSARTRHHMRAVLRTALQRAVKHGLVTRNVAELAAAPRVDDVESLILAPDQVRTLLDQVAGDRWEAIYVLAIATGLRQGEILGLTWPDVDLDAGVVHVTRQLQRRELVAPKTKKSRRDVGIPPSVVASLRSHRLRQEQHRRFLVRGDWGNEDELVFTNGMGGPVHGPHVTREFQRHLEAAALPRMSFHALRHTAASLMLLQGVDEKVRRAILGHSNAAMTAHYTHVLPAVMRDAADRMEGVIGR